MNYNMGKKKYKNQELPFVSVCTPTYNRRPFIPAMIECFRHQTYPQDKIEWIIIDDGTDKIEDLLENIENVKYFKYNKKMMLGKKRNLLHEKASGDIIVYMDDDDYYPPERIEHAVGMLQSHPKALCAGSSEIYIYFKHIKQMIQFGPYGPNHATAGTFAFKKELLKDHYYNDNAALAEEKEFLQNYTVPFVQLEPKKTILVFSHDHNTFDKKLLLENRHPYYVKDSDKKVEDFIKEENLKKFYMHDIEDKLRVYEPGKPEMKPDVLKQIDEIKKERQDMINKMTNNNMISESVELNKELLENLKSNPEEILKIIHSNQVKIQQNHELLHLLFSEASKTQIMGDINGKSQALTNEQVVDILQQQKMAIEKLTRENSNLKEKLK